MKNVFVLASVRGMLRKSTYYYNQSECRNPHHTPAPRPISEGIEDEMKVFDDLDIHDMGDSMLGLIQIA